jgi:hypothetical protein
MHLPENLSQENTKMQTNYKYTARWWLFSTEKCIQVLTVPCSSHWKSQSARLPLLLSQSQMLSQSRCLKTFKFSRQHTSFPMHCHYSELRFVTEETIQPLKDSRFRLSDRTARNILLLETNCAILTNRPSLSAVSSFDEKGNGRCAQDGRLLTRWIQTCPVSMCWFDWVFCHEPSAQEGILLFSLNLPTYLCGRCCTSRKLKIVPRSELSWSRESSKSSVFHENTFLPWIAFAYLSLPSVNFLILWASLFQD